MYGQIRRNISRLFEDFDGKRPVDKVLPESLLANSDVINACYIFNLILCLRYEVENISQWEANSRKPNPPSIGVADKGIGGVKVKTQYAAHKIAGNDPWLHNNGFPIRFKPLLPICPGRSVR